MHSSVKNLTYINNKIKEVINFQTNIIAISKTFGPEKIKPLLDFGHLHYGENKVQECISKWPELKLRYSNIKLHMVGKLQSNKVKDCIKHFDFIHSLDSKKLAKKINDEQKKVNKKLKIFVQVNIGNEMQKSGVHKNDLEDLLSYCSEINLDLIGLMCIPPTHANPNIYFSEMHLLNKKYGFYELSMGMSSDYLEAIKFGSTFVRIGSKIFGNRDQ
jgi:pyridoxal phosphate enzyme (YggS family)